MKSITFVMSMKIFICLIRSKGGVKNVFTVTIDTLLTALSMFVDVVMLWELAAKIKFSEEYTDFIFRTGC